MIRVRNGMDHFNRVLMLAKYVPYIGTAVNIVSNTLKAVRPTFNRACDRVTSIDRKIYQYKAKCDRGVDQCDKGKHQASGLVVRAYSLCIMK